MTPAQDFRKGPRRRGQALNDAIFAAAMSELTEFGYQNFSMERVAERARTGKTSVYRRWPSRAELVVDALLHNLPGKQEPPDTGDLRRDLLTTLRHMADFLDGPTGEAVRGLMSETLHDRELATVARAKILDTAPAPYLTILTRAATRGEIRPQALQDHVAAVAPTLLRQHFLIHGAPIPDDVLTRIVDDVMIPLVRAPEERPTPPKAPQHP
ncbi:TetR/AcrR family transcriptional regulator [Actinophytocola sediminis]